MAYKELIKTSIAFAATCGNSMSMVSKKEKNTQEKVQDPTTMNAAA